jgi:pimeloyl-ACP methyl ester carboxylesterase
VGGAFVSVYLATPVPAGAQRGSAITLAPAKPHVTEGYITTEDGVRLFYSVVGTGSRTVILPGRLFLMPTLRSLARVRRLVFYDTRARGKSDAVHDPARETILDDVRDMEAVRKGVGAEKVSLVGYSYMGLLVMLYAQAHPDHVDRIVQMDPVPPRFDATYPRGLTEDYMAALDSAAAHRVERLQKEGLDRDHPKEYCEADWDVNRFALVGDPKHVQRLSVTAKEHCAMPNEWPVNLDKHVEASIASIKPVVLTKASLNSITVPVLTVHGTRDRNAPYGGGREWAMSLPNARLLTVRGGAHQSFDEYPEIVLPALETFLAGHWPSGVEKVTALLPAQSRNLDGVSRTLPTVRRVGVGGRSIGAVVAGRGAATIVFESGLGVEMDDWRPLADSLSDVAVTVRYDRAGIGVSEPGVQPRTAEQVARDLHVLLVGLHTRPPYVLVGHSFGALFVRVFAHMFPKEVSGLVLIDPSDEQYRALQRTSLSREAFAAREARLIAAFPADGPPGPRAEFLMRDSSFAQAAAAWPLPSAPTVVLTSTRIDPNADEETRTLKSLWLKAHADFVRRANAVQVLTEAGHGIHEEQPGLAARAIRQVLIQTEPRRPSHAR